MTAQKIRDEIERIEEAYEYMLAYAAQGRSEEGAGPDGAHIRDFLGQFLKAVNTLDTLSASFVEENTASAGFFEGFGHETAVMRSVLEILLGSENISSEAIDNTNGLIAVRAYLTSLFFIDKVLLGQT